MLATNSVGCFATDSVDYIFKGYIGVVGGFAMKPDHFKLTSNRFDNFDFSMKVARSNTLLAPGVDTWRRYFFVALMTRA